MLYSSATLTVVKAIHGLPYRHNGTSQGQLLDMCPLYLEESG